MCFLWQPMLLRKPWIMIDPEKVPADNESIEDAPCYAPLGDLLIGLAQEALSFTRRRKLEKEIAVIKSALQGHENKPTTRLAKQLIKRVEKLKNELAKFHKHCLPVAVSINDRRDRLPQGSKAKHCCEVVEA